MVFATMFVSACTRAKTTPPEGLIRVYPWGDGALLQNRLGALFSFEPTKGTWGPGPGSFDRIIAVVPEAQAVLGVKGSERSIVWRGRVIQVPGNVAVGDLELAGSMTTLLLVAGGQPVWWRSASGAWEVVRASITAAARRLALINKSQPLKWLVVGDRFVALADYGEWGTRAFEFDSNSDTARDPVWIWWAGTDETEVRGGTLLLTSRRGLMPQGSVSRFVARDANLVLGIDRTLVPPAKHERAPEGESSPEGVMCLDEAGRIFSFGVGTGVLRMNDVGYDLIEVAGKDERVRSMTVAGDHVLLVMTDGSLQVIPVPPPDE